MDNASNYSEWKISAIEMDILEGKYRWKEDSKSLHFDHERIENNLETLRDLVDSGDIEAVMRYLRSRLMRNLGGIGNQELHTYLRCGTKSVIEEYVEEVVRALKLVAEEVCFTFEFNIRIFYFFHRTIQKSLIAENLHSLTKLGMLMEDPPSCFPVELLLVCIMLE